MLNFKGLLSGTAQFAYFAATNSVSQSISFPITSVGPTVVAFVIALFYKEVKGFKDYLLVFVGIFIATAGSIFCGISK